MGFCANEGALWFVLAVAGSCGSKTLSFCQIFSLAARTRKFPAFFRLSMRSSCGPCSTESPFARSAGRLTLLGDACHAMLPFHGARRRASDGRRCGARGVSVAGRRAWRARGAASLRNAAPSPGNARSSCLRDQQDQIPSARRARTGRAAIRKCGPRPLRPDQRK